MDVELWSDCREFLGCLLAAVHMTPVGGGLGAVEVTDPRPSREMGWVLMEEYGFLDLDICLRAYSTTAVL